ncbi:F-box protein At3g07870-like [Camellia sinensis]|uniref:F-box protein At3g07870-like n=1 Tax=Camellia sinensis TaxID=4442 RepID=UPI001035A3D9|nr:F-box protein At3g07870-like [Camellia sinensis]
MALSHETPSHGGLVVIGSFRSKTWTVVHFPYRVSSVKSSPVVNENLHWFTSTESWSRFFARHQVIYFNPRKNIFRKLPMPLPKDGNGDILLGLGVLEGCLCMVRSCEHLTDRMDRVEVLVMKKYGIKESWTSMFILSNLPNLHIYDNVLPLFFTKNGEILMKIGKNCVRAYNPNDNSQRDIRIPAYSPYFYAAVYEESLASPIDYN